jgi:ABC-type dipeptide/oligopeptide/nickel transport system ATPase subunit
MRIYIYDIDWPNSRVENKFVDLVFNDKYQSLNPVIPVRLTSSISKIIESGGQVALISLNI